MVRGHKPCASGHPPLLHSLGGGVSSVCHIPVLISRGECQWPEPLLYVTGSGAGESELQNRAPSACWPVIQGCVGIVALAPASGCNSVFWWESGIWRPSRQKAPHLAKGVIGPKMPMPGCWGLLVVSCTIYSREDASQLLSVSRRRLNKRKWAWTAAGGI